MNKLNFILLKTVRWSGWSLLPLIVLVLVHSVPAVYLALQRCGWIKPRAET